MSERRIVCPQLGCDGHNSPYNPCALCRGDGTIPERRKHTAADRAVERIKGQCEAQARQQDDKGGFISGAIFAVERILYIIREEAERGD